MCRGYQPIPRPPLNDAGRKHLPSHMIGHTHHRHYEQQRQNHAVIERQGENQCGDNEGPDQCLPRVEAHRRPSGGRSAGVVNRVKRAEQRRMMHRAVGPVEPSVMEEQAKKKR